MIDQTVFFGKYSNYCNSFLTPTQNQNLNNISMWNVYSALWYNNDEYVICIRCFVIDISIKINNKFISIT